MRLEALTCGWVIGPFRGEQHGDVRLPVPCFVIHHPQGVTLAQVIYGHDPEWGTLPQAPAPLGRLSVPA